MDPRWGVEAITYAWTDLDATNAMAVHKRYSELLKAGKSDEEAKLGLDLPLSTLHASPYHFLIPNIERANPRLQWHQLIVPGTQAKLTKREFEVWCTKPNNRRQLRRFALWRKDERLTWAPLTATDRKVVQSAPTLSAALKALHQADKYRYPAALYSPDSTDFKAFVRKVFEYWGNTEYRFHAIRGSNYDYNPAHEMTVIMGLKPEYAGHSLELVPISKPVKTVVPATPGKNKGVATEPPDLASHLAKLDEYADTSRRCAGYLDTLASHQARCAALARRFELFGEVDYPLLKETNIMPRLAAAAKRLASLSDEDVFTGARHAFTAPPAINLPGHVPVMNVPEEPPFPLGVASARNILNMLTSDATFGEAMRSWAQKSVEGGRGNLHASSAFFSIAEAITSMRVVDEDLAEEIQGTLSEHLLHAPDDAASSPQQLADSTNVAKTSLAWLGARVPTLFGNFSGPPSVSVAIGNAVGFLGAHKLLKNGTSDPSVAKLSKVCRKLFGPELADQIEAAAKQDPEALRKLLNHEFKKVPELAAGQRMGAPLPASNWQRPDRWANLALFQGGVVIAQYWATYNALVAFDDAAPGDKPFAALAFGINGMQSYTMTYELFAHGWGLARGVPAATSTLAVLGKLNFALAGITSAVEAGYNIGTAIGDFRNGRSTEGVLHLTKGAAHVALFYCMVYPFPPVQAGAMVALFAVDVLETILSQPNEIIVDLPVNRRVREMAWVLERSQHNPLGAFLSESERADIQFTVQFCNKTPIVHRYHNQLVVDTAGSVKPDVDRLRTAGFDLREISTLMGRTVSAEELS